MPASQWIKWEMPISPDLPIRPTFQFSMLYNQYRVVQVMPLLSSSMQQAILSFTPHTSVGVVQNRVQASWWIRRGAPMWQELRTAPISEPQQQLVSDRMAVPT